MSSFNDQGLSKRLAAMLGRLVHPIRVIFSQPLALLSAPKKMLGMSLATRVAVLTFLFLLTVSIVVFLIPMMQDDAANWKNFFTPWYRTLVIGLLLVIIPFVCHKLVRLWLEEEASRFPAIDKAWDAGIQALAEQRLDLASLPLYLVLGPRDHAQATAIMSSSERNFVVDGTPGGGAPLQWFIGDDCIYLCCTDITRVGALSKRLESGSGMVAAPTAPQSGGGGKSIFAATMNPGADNLGGDVPSFGQTMAPGAGGVPDDSAPVAPAAFAGTMMPGGVVDYEGPAAVAASTQSASIARLSQSESNEITERLSYVCSLIRRTRQPYCPVNGVVSYIPFKLVVRSDQQAAELQTAVRGDTDTIVAGLKLRAQLMVLVGGLEEFSGFRELVRRVGKDQAKAGRFGKGFPLWCKPTPEQLEALTRHACGQFEDWAYSLFRQDKQLKNHGNPKLYSLLCLIRSSVVERLLKVNIAGFAREGAELEKALLFSGCYFGATGNRPDRQAFVRSVFDKLHDQLNELDWHQDVRLADMRFNSIRNILLCVNVLLMIAMGVIIYLYVTRT